jgi:hypothetical protein
MEVNDSQERHSPRTALVPHPRLLMSSLCRVVNPARIVAPREHILYAAVVVHYGRERWLFYHTSLGPWAETMIWDVFVEDDQKDDREENVTAGGAAARHH